jgi:hypothetical protein
MVAEKFVIQEGMVLSRLTILRHTGEFIRPWDSMWECRCECGNICYQPRSYLRTKGKLHQCQKCAKPGPKPYLDPVEKKRRMKERDLRWSRTIWGLFKIISQRHRFRCENKNWPPPDYDAQYLYDRYNNDVKFIRVYKEWIDSGYIKKKTPSIDRINNKLPYSRNNIHILTWEENQYKSRMEIKNRSRPIERINPETGEIVVFASIQRAVAALNLSQAGINGCVCGRLQRYKGFIWRYKDYVPEAQERNQKRYVVCKICGKETKKLYGDYCSVSCGNVGKEKCARVYKMVSPEGKEIEIFNMSKFCRENQLNISCMCEVARGIKKHHRGWTKAC